ncbi:polysaccharide pyruvyl transferase WcaK-like protein [Paramicrobacterium agarici]|uniref:Polysaccharide pyruvyl transferase WcaK-like protein n=2 Tax=Paramicrobacterium agarici TaxID=630514 RepID=A0A2A9DZ59_9MICO|nr:polysaccharide pyruvyl transferase WcaK-like protein [Microbacterium agarici]
MTEAAIGELQSRGIADITIIAAEAAPAQKRYGVSAIDRFGFGTRWNRKRLEERYTTLVSEIANDFGTMPPEDPAHAILDLVRRCDAVIIAGGGNITSRYLYHVYERSVLTKLAKKFGKPLLMTSQTIGPSIDDAHLGIVAEILTSASMIGARELDSLALIGDLTAGRATAYRTLDDAFHLRADAADEEWVAALNLDDRFVVASVSPYVSNPFWSEDEYFTQMAAILDSVAAELDETVYLLPHAGSPIRDEKKHDQISHERVIKTSSSSRIYALPVMSARECLAVMKKATLAVSTRYHPIVLGQSVGTPTISIGVDAYSFVRMYGAQKNFETAELHLPARRATADAVSALSSQVAAQRRVYEQHIKAIEPVRRAEAKTWWDALVERIRESSGGTVPSFAEVPSLKLANVEAVSCSEHAAHNELSLMYDSLIRERKAKAHTEDIVGRVGKDRDQQRQARLAAESEISTLRSELVAANSRKVVRLADKLGAVVRALRRRKS